MIVADDGYAYVGNFGFDRALGEEPRATALIGITPEGAASVVADGFEFPNGMSITPDGKTLLVAESRGRRIVAFDRARDGSLSNRRLWGDLGQVRPDGICLDAEGAVWVADVGSGDAIRIREGGTVLDRLEFGERRPFACVLGGDDRKTLYLCTNIAPQPTPTDTRNGRVESCRVAVAGAGLP
jgi:sugar lactone lactonase YvrE